MRQQQELFDIAWRQEFTSEFVSHSSEAILKKGGPDLPRCGLESNSSLPVSGESLRPITNDAP